MSTRDDSVTGCAALVVLALNIILGGWSTQYVIQFWATFIKHVAVHVPFLPCAIAGLFIGELSIPLAIATWIISFVI